MHCYGKSFDRRAECTGCKLRDYCAQAGDPPLLANQAPPPEINERLLEKGLRDQKRVAEERRKNTYTREEMLELIAFMIAMDDRTLQLLEIKLAEPTLNLSDIAAKRGVSRQAMHRMVKMRLCRIPELRPVFDLYQCRHKVNKETTLLEEAPRRAKVNKRYAPTGRSALAQLEKEFEILTAEYQKRKKLLESEA